jgi:D-alanyl-D-alanine carboxypeptidase/D-alanyl-D-alanine-endopeptidase (penicillin-binding protein 4)
LKELSAFLEEVGLGPDDCAFADGSGLSRLTLVKPAAVVALLAYMFHSPHGPAWRTLLPIGGEDGTLMKRFPGRADAQRIQAKTGSLTHVNSLSGYASSKTYGDIAFSILVNNTVAPASEVRDAIDKIGLALVQ